MTSNSGIWRHELPSRLCWAALISISAACAPTPEPATPSSQPTTPVPPPAPTASALPTSTPLPSPTAAQESGLALLVDDFSRNRGWELQEGPSGAVSLLEDRLVISVRGPSALLTALSPAAEVSDFELEVTVRSEICDGSDEFGLLARVRSPETHYRFTLSCEGAVRASRFVDGREAALAAPAVSEAAFSGAPAINRLRLQAEGNQFRFSVNGIQVLELTDSQIASGATGLIVRARRSTQTTISFDDFRLWEVGGG